MTLITGVYSSSGLGMWIKERVMAEIVRIVLSPSHSEHETDTELEMKTKKNSNRVRRSNSESRYGTHAIFS